jgi:hypothetical protein
MMRDLPSSKADFDAEESLKIALRYTFLIFGPCGAMVRCCEPGSLVALLERESQHELADDSDPKLEDIVRWVLQAFEVPDVLDSPSVTLSLPWPWPIVIPASLPGLLTATEAVYRIEAMESELSQEISRQRFNRLWAREITFSARSVLEDVLRFSLAYFGLHFATYLPDSIIKPLWKSSFADLIQFAKQLERLFSLPEPGSERDLPHEKKNVEYLQDECLRHFGRLSPFSSVRLEQLGLAPIACDTFNGVRISLQRAKEILECLISAVVVPRIVIVLGSGNDDYGNHMIWFTDKQQTPINTPLELEWMYASSIDFKPFQCFAMLAQDIAGASAEPLIEPAMYPIEVVEKRINTGLERGSLKNAR